LSEKIWSPFLMPLYQKYWPHTTFILHPFHFFQKKVDPNINYPYNFCFKIPITHI
jgi:hypothetical protein